MDSSVEPQSRFDNFKFGIGPILNWFTIIGINLKQTRAEKLKHLLLIYEVGLLLSSIWIIIISYVGH